MCEIPEGIQTHCNIRRKYFLYEYVAHLSLLFLPAYCFLVLSCCLYFPACFALDYALLQSSCSSSSLTCVQVCCKDGERRQPRARHCGQDAGWRSPAHRELREDGDWDDACEGYSLCPDTVIIGFKNL